MSNQPDKIFRHKLEGHQMTVPSSAWSKVEDNLQPKTNSYRWLKVAAVFLLMVGAASWFVLPNSQSQFGTIAAVEIGNDKIITQDTDTQVQVLKEAAPITAIDKTPNGSDLKKRTTPQEPVRRSIESRTTSSAVVRQSEEIPALTLQEETSNEAIENENSIESISESPVEENVTLVLSAEEVNAKYLTKKPEEEATTDNEKTSTLQKLLKKARGLKHNQDPFGELRQKKNEILALNFNSDNERTQNR